MWEIYCGNCKKGILPLYRFSQRPSENNMISKLAQVAKYIMEESRDYSTESVVPSLS